MLQSPFKIIIIAIQLMFLGINTFFALLRTHFNPCFARAKMNVSRAKNIFMPANINSIVIIDVDRTRVYINKKGLYCTVPSSMKIINLQMDSIIINIVYAYVYN